MKFEILKRALGLLRPLNKIYNAIKGILPKRKSDATNDALLKELRELKEDVKKHERKLKEIVTKDVEKIVPTPYFQAEMYVSVVIKGKQGGSESAGYILINLPKDKFLEAKQKLFNMPVKRIKELLKISENKIVKSVSKGETISKIREEFFEINGQKQKFSMGLLE